MASKYLTKFNEIPKILHFLGETNVQATDDMEKVADDKTDKEKDAKKEEPKASKSKKKKKKGKKDKKEEKKTSAVAEGEKAGSETDQPVKEIPGEENEPAQQKEEPIAAEEKEKYG